MVYVGIDPCTQDAFAIKTFALAQALDVSLDDARHRFRRESRIAASLRHPDIVRVHAAGEEAGHAYLVMELLSGRNLARYTQAAQLLPEPVVLEIGARVAGALAYAHAHGVIHRDIKPANVMLDLTRHRVTLMDFGIATLADLEHQRGASVFGSPATMAPEQLIDAPVDARADLYALGVVMFQMLTGRLPFQGRTVERLAEAIVHEPALRLGTLRPDLPPSLGMLIDGLLEKSPARRPSNGDLVVRALRASVRELTR